MENEQNQNPDYETSYLLRMSKEMKQELETLASKNRRTLKEQILWMLERSLEAEKKPAIQTT